MSAVEFYSPQHLLDAFEVLDEKKDPIVICGGMTHLLRCYKDFPQGVTDALEAVVHIGDLKGLAECKEEDGRYTLGATATITELEADPNLAKYAGSLSAASQLTSTPQIRNMRTVGGEIAWGSYHSPLIASLLAMGAKVRVRRGASQQQPGYEENLDLLQFYEDDLERRGVNGSTVVSRRAQLGTRDLILKVILPYEKLRRTGSFSFVRALTPKISTENSGVVVAAQGVAQNGVLTHARFVASGVWMWTLMEELPFEGVKLQPTPFYEKLYNFCDRYPFDNYRRTGPSSKQLSLIVFGLLKEGFSGLLGR